MRKHANDRTSADTNIYREIVKAAQAMDEAFQECSDEHHIERDNRCHMADKRLNAVLNHYGYFYTFDLMSDIRSEIAMKLRDIEEEVKAKALTEFLKEYGGEK